MPEPKPPRSRKPNILVDGYGMADKLRREQQQRDEQAAKEVRFGRAIGITLHWTIVKPVQIALLLLLAVISNIMAIMLGLLVLMAVAFLFLVLYLL